MNSSRVSSFVVYLSHGELDMRILLLFLYFSSRFPKVNLEDPLNLVPLNRSLRKGI